MSDSVLLALPSKGAIAEPTLSFLRDCGLRVEKPNERQYVGNVPSIPNLSVLFQRVKDVVYKVSDGTVQLGITGFDVVREHPHNDLVVVHEGLGYGYCKLVVAVPESWVDVDGMADLSDVAADLRRLHGRSLRVATTYTGLARQFLHSRGIHHFSLVRAEGAIEAAPTIGYADIVVDLVQTGTTLRENHLKPLGDGTIIESQACLIGNMRALRQQPVTLEIAHTMLEFIDASLQGKQVRQLTINLQGTSPADIARQITECPVTQGLKGPTIAQMFGDEPSTSEMKWYTVTINVKSRDLLEAVRHLRKIGSSQVVVSPVNFVFHDQSSSYLRLLDLINH